MKLCLWLHPWPRLCLHLWLRLWLWMGLPLRLRLRLGLPMRLLVGSRTRHKENNNQPAAGTRNWNSRRRKRRGSKPHTARPKKWTAALVVASSLAMQERRVTETAGGKTAILGNLAKEECKLHTYPCRNHGETGDMSIVHKKDTRASAQHVKGKPAATTRMGSVSIEYGAGAPAALNNHFLNPTTRCDPKPDCPV